MIRIKYLLVIVLLAVILYAHDTGMHVYIGSKTFELWRNYDQDFYNALMLPDTSVTGMTVRKFYYIVMSTHFLLDRIERFYYN